MTGDIFGAVLDFGYLTALWFPGILLARAIGQRATWASLTLGFLLSTVAVVVLFHATALFGATDKWWLTSKSVLLLLMAATAWIGFRRGDRAALRPLGIALSITALAVILRNLLRWDGRLRGPDQFLVSWISSLAQSGHDPSLFGGAEYVKRGFAFPLLLAQGREGQLLLSITIVILILALISTFLLASSIGTQWNPLGISLGIALIILWLATPLVWGMAFYVNGHVLMALAIAILATQIVSKSAGISRTPTEVIAIWTAGFTIASTRPEGVALALIISLPLFLRPPLETPRQAAWRLVAILGAPVGFVLWFVTVEIISLSALLTAVISIGLILAVGGLFLVLYLKPSLHHTVVLLVGGALLVAAVFQLLGSPPGLKTLTVFANNSFLGAGWWGLLPWFFLGAFTLHALFRTDQRVTALVNLTAFAVLFTVAVKIVDGLVIVGGIPGLSPGWSDSINRSFVHLIALSSALFLRLGALTAAEQKWPNKTQPAPLPPARSYLGA